MSHQPEEKEISLDVARRLPSNGSISGGVSSEVSVISISVTLKKVKKIHERNETDCRTVLGKGRTDGTRESRNAEMTNNVDIATDIRCVLSVRRSDFNSRPREGANSNYAQKQKLIFGHS